jgi:hypothetical protein
MIRRSTPSASQGPANSGRLASPYIWNSNKKRFLASGKAKHGSDLRQKTLNIKQRRIIGRAGFLCVSDRLSNVGIGRRPRCPQSPPPRPRRWGRDADSRPPHLARATRREARGRDERRRTKKALAHPLGQGEAKVNLPCARTPEDRHFRLSPSKNERRSAVSARTRNIPKQHTAKMQHV